MVDSMSLCDLAELKRLSEILANITSDQSSQKYSTVVSTSGEQLLLTRAGNPILRFGIDGNEECLPFEAGMKLIENLIENFDNFRHFVLFYDDAEVARRIEFQYLKVGLQKGEVCYYVIADDDVESPESIRMLMDSFGIDTVHCIENNQLVFLKIADPAKEPQGFIPGSQRIIDSLSLEQKRNPPIRIVVHMRYQLKTKEEIACHAEYEGIFDSTVKSFNGSALCNHNIGKYRPETHGDWARSCLQTHGVSFVICSENNRSIVLRNNSSTISTGSPMVATRRNNDEEANERIDLEIQDLSVDELNESLLEIKSEIDFLVSQVKFDLDSYSPTNLQNALSKISILKRKEGMMEAHRRFLTRRSNRQN